MKKIKKVFASIAILFLLLTIDHGLSTVYAAVPHLINYQGRITDTSGNPLTGSYNITFRIYDAVTAGSLLWEESQAGVVVDKGLFAVLLGSVTALNIPFDKAYFLEIKVGTEVMSPRQRITSAGYAIRAEVAETVSGIDPGMVGTKAVDESNIGDGKALVYKAASGKYGLENLTSNQAKSGFTFGVVYKENSLLCPISWGTIFKSKPFTKTGGLNFINCYLLARSMQGVQPYIRLKISNLTGSGTAVASSTYKEMQLSIDVSSLIAGQTYEVEVQTYLPCCNTDTVYLKQVIFEHVNTAV